MQTGLNVTCNPKNSSDVLPALSTCFLPLQTLTAVVLMIFVIDADDLHTMLFLTRHVLVFVPHSVGTG